MTTAVKAYDDIVDLFARGTSPDQICDFRPSAAAQQRATYLLDRNRAGELTDEETAELDRLSQLEHFMQLVKARARLYTQGPSQHEPSQHAQ